MAPAAPTLMGREALSAKPLLARSVPPLSVRVPLLAPRLSSLLTESTPLWIVVPPL